MHNKYNFKGKQVSISSLLMKIVTRAIHINSQCYLAAQMKDNLMCNPFIVSPADCTTCFNVQFR